MAYMWRNPEYPYLLLRDYINKSTEVSACIPGGNCEMRYWKILWRITGWIFIEELLKEYLQEEFQDESLNEFLEKITGMMPEIPKMASERISESHNS